MTTQREPTETEIVSESQENESQADPVAIVEELAGTQGFVDKRLDLVVSAGVVAIGAFLLWGSYQFRQGLVQQELVGATGLPRLLGGFLILAGAILVLRRLRAWGHLPQLVPTEGGDADEPGYPSTFIRPFIFVFFGVIWMMVLPFLGYVIATPLLGVILLLLADVREWPKLIGVPLGFVVVTWLLFDRMIGITLPAGNYIGQWLDQVVPRF